MQNPFNKFLVKNPKEQKVSKKIIELPTDEALVNKLKNKLQEYIKRLKQAEVSMYQAPEVIAQNTNDTRYKIFVLGELLKEGKVDEEMLKEKVKVAILKENQVIFDENSFNNAITVIKDYVETGGKNVSGGTGF